VSKQVILYGYETQALTPTKHKLYWMILMWHRKLLGTRRRKKVWN